MVNFTIRRADFSDIQRIVKLRLLSQNHFERSNSLIWRITEIGKQPIKQRVQNDLTDDNVRIFLAEADGDTIGYVQGEVSERSDYSPRIVGHISEIYVIEHCRRKGIGTRLMKELWNFFSSRKAKQLTVGYVIGNKEAEGFWTRLGFTPIITTGSMQLREFASKLKVMTLQEK
jgi:ribosomal protein S18 acetylase RimI-like enzyme